MNYLPAGVWIIDIAQRILANLQICNCVSGNKESYQEALDLLQQAIHIDQEDVTLYFKFAFYAAKFKKFHLARSALEESLYNQQRTQKAKLLKPQEGM